MVRVWRLLVVAIVLVVASSALGACNGDDGRTGVDFGSGVLPETVPEDFPLPQGSVIAGTLIDWDRDRTEVNMVLPAQVAVVARFFEENLVNRGYTVTSSSGSEAGWAMTFTRDELTGAIDMTGQQEATQATLELIIR